MIPLKIMQCLGENEFETMNSVLNMQPATILVSYIFIGSLLWLRNLQMCRSLSAVAFSITSTNRRKTHINHMGFYKRTKKKCGWGDKGQDFHFC